MVKGAAPIELCALDRCHAKSTFARSKGKCPYEIRALRPVCNLVNLVAMVMVLLLGTVSVRAAADEHAQGWSIGSPVEDHGHSHEVLPDHHQGGAAMHCGAPILGPDPLVLDCRISVAGVSYSGLAAGIWTNLKFENLRPPRR